MQVKHVAGLLLSAVLFSLSAKAESPECLISFDAAQLDVCNDEWQLVNDDLRHLANITAYRDSDYRVIKFDRPIHRQDREALTALGIEILGYVPHYGYKVRMRPSMDASVIQLDNVAWVGPFLPIWKVGINLANDLQLRNVRGNAPDVDTLTVTLHAGAGTARAESGLLSIPGLELVSKGSSAEEEYLVMGFDAARLERIVGDLAANEHVAAIKFRFPNQLLNSQGVWLHQSGKNNPPETPLFEQGLFGCGQTIGILDSGMDVGHCSFDDPDPANEFPFTNCTDGDGCSTIGETEEHRKIGAFYNWHSDSGGPGDPQGHGTSVAGNALGSNWNDPVDCGTLSTPGAMSDLDGMAPGARAIMQSAGASLQYLNDNGGNLYHAATTAFENDAYVHNNSWGGGCRNLVGQCIAGCIVEYRANSRFGDMAAWENPEQVIFAAAGNSGAGCGPGADVGSPGNAKSVFSIGGTRRGDNGDDVAGFSSRGPASDRRTKPDILAQSEAVMTSDLGSACGTSPASGTSFGSPTAAGFGALVREYLQRGFYPLGFEVAAYEIPAPSGALIRAIMTNSAVQISGTGSGTGFPNQDIGWGRLLADNSLYFEGDERFLWIHDEKDGLNTGETDVHQVTSGDQEELIVTLIWHDFPAELNANPHIVNQLRLEVETPSGDTWAQKLTPGGGLTDANPFQDTRTGDHDNLNTVHQIMLDALEQGTYEIRVIGIQVAMGDAQPYALAVTGDLLDIADPDIVLTSSPTQLAVCQGDDAAYDISALSVSEFEDPVSLSVTGGLPSNVNASFSVNPLTPSDPAAESMLTISDTASGAVGDYTLEVTGESNGPEFDPVTKTVNLGLTLDESLGAPTLLSPGNGSIDTALRPDLEWAGIPGAADYTLQVATDADFNDLAIDSVVEGAAFAPDVDLATGTDYYWRVRGNNACGNGDWSAEFEFQTRFMPVAQVTPASFDLTVNPGEVLTETLSIANVGTGNLVWALDTDATEAAAPGLFDHDPALDESFTLPNFVAEGGDNPPVVEFTIEPGLDTFGDVVGVTFEGTAAGISGQFSWASDTCMLLEAPDGTTFAAGGFSSGGPIPACNDSVDWDFQGPGSDENDTYASVHDDVFDPPQAGDGQWSVRFVNYWVDAGAADISWSNVRLTLHKQPPPVCLETTVDVPWLTLSPTSGSSAEGDSDEIILEVDGSQTGGGTVEGFVCINSNDVDQPLLLVPVSAEIIAPILLEDRFEAQ